MNTGPHSAAHDYTPIEQKEPVKNAPKLFSRLKEWPTHPDFRMGVWMYGWMEVWEHGRRGVYERYVFHMSVVPSGLKFTDWFGLVCRFCSHMLGSLP